MRTRILLTLGDVVGEHLPTTSFEWLDDAADVILVDVSQTRREWYRGGFGTVYTVVLLQRLGIDLPLIPGMSIHLGRPGEYVELEATAGGDPLYVSLGALEITLHVPPSILTEYRQDSSTGVWVPLPAIEFDPATGTTRELPGTKKGLDIIWETAVEASLTGDVSFSATSPAGLVNWAMVADTGLLLRFEDLEIVTDQLPDWADTDRIPAGFRGVLVRDAEVAYAREGSTGFPPIGFRDLAIGSGGFSGTVAVGSRDHAEDDLTAPQLDGRESLVGPGADYEFHRIQFQGMQAVLQYFAIVFAQSVPSSSLIAGHLFMPFVDRWLKFKASIAGPDGEFLLELGGATGDPLISLENEWLEITADSISYLRKDGVHYAAVSGTVRPKFEGFDWPKFRVERLLVGAAGDIEIEGGWLECPEQVTLDFHGFRIGIDKLGLGNEGASPDRRQWLGLSGEVSLVEGIPLSASVEGLTISWNPDDASEAPRVRLDGIGVHLEIPNALVLDGAIGYREVDESDDELSGHVFSGHVKVDLPSLKTEIGGELLIGRLRNAQGESFTAFYILLDADLPTPIPLGSTGTAVHALRGLFAAHMAPDRQPIEGAPEPWYEWYKADRPEDTAYTVTKVRKWAPRFDHYGFGAGLTLGTHFDDGYSLNVRALAAILLPGPVVVIEGRADLLSAPSGDEQESGAFYALAVFDGLASTFQVNVDVAYALEPAIEAGGGLEAFFDFTDPGNWHLHLGKKEPDSKRIQAHVLALFTANAYLMIDRHGVQTGAFIGFEWRAELGPISLTLVARIAFDAGIFWKPVQLEGTLALYGEVALRVFGIGIALAIEAVLEGRAPTPYRVYGRFSVALSLPWPLPDPEATLELEWTTPARPDPVVPFLSSAALAHHKQIGAAWTLQAADAAAAGDPAAYPVFPVDVRPVLSFARPIYELSRQRADDGSLVAIEKDRVGDYEFSYVLRDVVLHAYDRESGTWTVVRQGVREAGGGSGFVIDNESFAAGRDAQEPQVELWRYGTLDRSTVYRRESYADEYPPCAGPVMAPTHCVDWQDVADRTRYPREFRHRTLRFVVDHPRPGGPAAVPEVAGGGLLTPAVTVRLPEPAGWLEIRAMPWQGSEARVIGYGDGRRLGEWVSDGGVVSYAGPAAIDAFRLLSDRFEDGLVPVLSICYRMFSDLRDERATTPGGGTGTPAPPEPPPGTLVLAPDRAYRLTIQTRTEGERDSDDPRLAEHVFRFRTDHGPGTAPASAAHAPTPLNELATYVARTRPAHGARTFYYGDDLGIEFNESYVDRMYTAPLRLRLRDRNGALVGAPEGTWGSAMLPRWEPSLMTWRSAEASAGCASLTEAPAPGRYLSRPTPPELEPERLYTAVVLTDGWDRPERPLYSFQFITSRYRTAGEHLASGCDPVTREQVVRIPPSGPRPPLDWVAEHDALMTALADARRQLHTAIGASDAEGIVEHAAAVRAARSRLDDFNASTFERLDRGDDSFRGVHERFHSVGLGHRPLPPALELVQLDVDGSGDKFLLLESPEPLDWDRLSLTLGDAGGAITFRTIWNRDRTRAFLFRQAAWLASGRYEVELVFTGGHTPELGPVTRGGIPVEDRVQCRLRLP